MSDDRNYLHGMNMTNFFTRELFMYSLGDISFKKPISLKKMAYTTAFLILWSLPLILIFGLNLNPYFMALVLVPPFVIGHFATKPIFAGKTLVPFAKDMIGFILEPRGWTDLTGNNKIDNDDYFVEHEYWISRRAELNVLADLKEEEFNKEHNIRVDDE